MKKGKHYSLARNLDEWCCASNLCVSISSARFVLIRRLIILSSKTLYKCNAILAWGAIVSKLFFFFLGCWCYSFVFFKIAMKKMCRKEKVPCKLKHKIWWL